VISNNKQQIIVSIVSYTRQIDGHYLALAPAEYRGRYLVFGRIVKLVFGAALVENQVNIILVIKQFVLHI